MIRLIRGYLRTLGQYARAPKTRFEYKHYAKFLLLYAIALAVVWGGIYLCHGNY